MFHAVHYQPNRSSETNLKQHPQYKDTERKGLLVHYVSTRKGLVLVLIRMLIGVAQVLFQLEIDVKEDSYEERETNTYLCHHYVVSVCLKTQMQSDHEAMTRKVISTNSTPVAKSTWTHTHTHRLKRKRK